MSKYNQAKEEFLCLKDKVQERIKELQGKLTPQQLANSRSTDEKYVPCHYYHCHHNCHHCPHSQHLSTCHQHSHQRQNNIKHSPSNGGLSNQMISEALIKSQQHQREISEQIRLISQKIENINVSQSKSHLSQQFSQTALRPNNVRKHRNSKYEDERNRCKSQIKKQDQSSDKCLRQNYKNSPNIIKSPHYEIKKITNKTKRQYQNVNDLNIIKSKDRNIPKSKSKSNNKKLKGMKSQYCLSLCPIHEKDKILSKRSRNEEIYIDSDYRNRKHEKNHLIESFKQQQKSKKKLISKIIMNAFNQYGKR